MATDGGGWMLVLNYRRDGSNVEGLVQGVLPLSESTGYSHQFLMQFSGAVTQLTKEVRLFCSTSEHDRIIHFKSTHQGVVGIAVRGLTASNSADWWRSNETTTLLEGHTAALPFRANATNEDSPTRSLYDGFLTFPFFRYGTHHWAIRALGRWECDNAERYQDDTLHQVWVRG
uniref:Fibrinogen C-terminal domain-containing protein n=1 Tax=Cryptomonas curvata TaxID=233186 RepID=A0A7S0MGU2_9CRYP|mmetsp:Transcript_40474/g.84549  ORF Transcript_40474/g.84549 Transcript_40474/m.84549 type:complete len:173 (+) Transcript_40474:3-521(+)